MTLFRFAHMTIVTIGRPGCIGMTDLTISVVLRGVTVMTLACSLVGTPERGIMADRAVIGRLGISMAVLTGKIVGLSSSMVLIADVSGMAIQTARDGGHGAVAGGTVDFIAHFRSARVVLLRQMVRSAKLTQVAGQAIRQDPNAGVALGAVSGQRWSRLVMFILLRHKVVTLRTVTAGGHTDVALITEPLLSSG